MKKKTSLNPKLIEILVCPLTKGPLHYNAQKKELISPLAKLAYPIRDGVPVMLVDEARPLKEDELGGKTRREARNI